MRSFYFSEFWREARERLPGPVARRQVRWWDMDGDLSAAEPSANAIAQSQELVDPALDPSIRGRLDGLVETFVVGWPRSRLIRNVGFGMDPPFKRMEGRYRPVVEMRTQATRTFGFFVREAVFVALRLDLADNTHRDTSLYGRYGENVMRLIRRMEPTEVDGTSDVESLIGECGDNARE